MRPLFIAGNWKMNPSNRDDALALAREVKQGVGSETTPRVALCPPSLFLHGIDDILAGSPIGLGAQNMNDHDEGAYTGELSGKMLVDAGCTHVILGHSERRHGMGETSEQVNAKLVAALKAGLIPIVCIGETEAERAAEETETVLASQLKESLANLSPEQMSGVVLAYEPVWAIGTGKTATPEQAQAAHRFLRTQLGDLFDPATADRVVVQYGGSLKPDNAREVLACEDIDGGLIGGASLKSADFLQIIAAAREVAAAAS